MTKDKLEILVLIPARGGSKRLPGKNIKDLLGKPLIAWTIEAALQSSLSMTVAVSTDCTEIAKVSGAFGAEVPFIRPKEISGDETEMPEVIDHCLAYYKGLGQEFTHLLVLQPTCPLRTVNDVEEAVQMLLKKQAQAIYSVCEVEHSPLWSSTLPEDQSFEEFLPTDIAGIRSQDLPVYYRLNGAIYLVNLKSYEKNRSLFQHEDSYAFIMDRANSVDIDESLDFVVAEAILKLQS